MAQEALRGLLVLAREPVAQFDVGGHQFVADAVGIDAVPVAGAPDPGIVDIRADAPALAQGHLDAEVRQRNGEGVGADGEEHAPAAVVGALPHRSGERRFGRDVDIDRVPDDVRDIDGVRAGRQRMRDDAFHRHAHGAQLREDVGVQPAPHFPAFQKAETVLAGVHDLAVLDHPDRGVRDEVERLVPPGEFPGVEGLDDAREAFPVLTHRLAVEEGAARQAERVGEPGIEGVGAGFGERGVAAGVAFRRGGTAQQDGVDGAAFAQPRFDRVAESLQVGAVVPECGIDFGMAALEVNVQAQDVRAGVLGIRPEPSLPQDKQDDAQDEPYGKGAEHYQLTPPKGEFW